MLKGVCHFGSYDPDYSRNRIIKKGLELNGINVYQCNAQGLIIFRYLKLFGQFLKIKNKISCLIIGFPGHYDVPLAFILGKVFGKKVFFDIFTSTYETYVIDREVIPIKSLSAVLYFLLDWIGLHLSDIVLADTKTHAKFFSTFYKIRLSKFIVVYLGSNNEIFRPRKVFEKTDVLFYGSYQPLQGADIIVKAAAYLPKVKFKMIGEGKTRRTCEDIAGKLNVKNVEFVDWLRLDKLSNEIVYAKITLGIFGASSKAKSVIPNKVFDSVGSKKLVITLDTESVRELFKNNESIVLIEENKPEQLSEAISKFIKNNVLREKIANKGYNLYLKFLKPKVVVKPIINCFS